MNNKTIQNAVKEWEDDRSIAIERWGPIGEWELDELIIYECSVYCLFQFAYLYL